jgi:hypothetical protein
MIPARGVFRVAVPRGGVRLVIIYLTRGKLFGIIVPWSDIFLF